MRPASAPFLAQVRAVWSRRLALRPKHDADSRPFSPLRTGLDHLALQLAAREDIDQWITHLDAIGVEHETLLETAEPAPHALVLVRDPDGIPIGLFWFGAEMASEPKPRLGPGPGRPPSSELPSEAEEIVRLGSLQRDA